MAFFLKNVKHLLNIVYSVTHGYELNVERSCKNVLIVSDSSCLSACLNLTQFG